MKNPVQCLHSAIVSGLIAALLFTQTAIAQDPSAQAGQDAAQQASQQAIQANQQAAQQAAEAAQQASDAAQRANQQAMQQMQDMENSQSSSSVPIQLGGVKHPPAPQVPVGAVAARIAAAHTILLTNVGISARLGLDPNHLYNDIHSRLQQWGYYQLVSNPQQADLVFQLDEIDPRNGENVTPGTDLYNRTPYFRIVIVDARTEIPLWTITSPIYITGKKTYAHWMDISEQNLITRLKALAQQPVSAPEQAALTHYPPNHRTALFLGLAAAGVGGVLALTFIGLHSMKSHQDSFCQAHNIPADMCAGG